MAVTGASETRDVQRSSEDAVDERRSFSSGRRWAGRISAFAGIALALYCVALVNGIAYRHPWRIDLTEDASRTLSDETRAVLGLVTQDIDVILPYYVIRDNPMQLAQARVLERARELITEYSAIQPRIRLLAEVNVLTDGARWKLLCDEYDLHPTHVNRLIFVMGAGASFRQSVTPQDLAVMEPAADRVMAPPKVVSFRGERAITDAVSRLVHQNRRRVYFTRGHGELEVRPTSRAAGGLAAVVHDLEVSGFEVPDAQLDLSRVRRVPEDCELLIVAGPEQPFTREEIDVLQDYLRREGRLFVALGLARTGLEDLLERWGIEVRAGSVRLRAEGPDSRFESSWVVSRSFNPAHVITGPFSELGERFDVRLLAPRPLQAVGAPRRLVSDRLLSATSAEGEKYYVVGGDGLTGDGADASFVLAAATEQEVPAIPPEGWERLATRIVCIGSASFLRDSQASGSLKGSFRTGTHRDFFMNCVNWLVGQEELVTKGSGRQEEERQLAMTPDIRFHVLLSSLVIFPGIFLSLGAFVYFTRRS